MPTPEEIRQIVSRVVDGVLPAAAGSATAPQPASAPAPQPDATGRGAIAIGADHGGFPLKERIAFRLKELGYDVHDCGTASRDAVDYPDFAHAVARKVAAAECGAGIVVDGAGIGSCMVANKVPGVRAALCYDVSSARNSREHNHAHVLTLGAGLIGENLAWQIVTTWLETPWGGDRHARRVAMIGAVEAEYSKGAT